MIAEKFAASYTLMYHLLLCRPTVTLFHDASRRSQRGSHCHKIYAVAAVEVKTVKIGTRGSPLALAQAYMTRDKLKVKLIEHRNPPACCHTTLFRLGKNSLQQALRCACFTRDM